MYNVPTYTEVLETGYTASQERINVVSRGLPVNDLLFVFIFYLVFRTIL